MARHEGGAVLAADSENRNGPRTGGAFITCKAGAFTRSPRRREMVDHLRPPAGEPGAAGGVDAGGAARAPPPRRRLLHPPPRHNRATLPSPWELLRPSSNHRV